MSKSAAHPDQCLRDFVHGEISPLLLEKCLGGKAQLQFWSTKRREVNFRGRLPITYFTREDIDARLQDFLSGKLSAQELSDWAATIRLFGCFKVHPEKEAADSSAIWDLLDEIMSPDIWEPLTVDTVLDLRRRFADL